MTVTTATKVYIMAKEKREDLGLCIVCGIKIFSNDSDIAFLVLGDVDKIKKLEQIPEGKVCLEDCTSLDCAQVIHDDCMGDVEIH